MGFTGFMGFAGLNSSLFGYRRLVEVWGGWPQGAVGEGAPQLRHSEKDREVTEIFGEKGCALNPKNPKP